MINNVNNVNLYKNKYLKYKNKYLNFVQTGSSNLTLLPKIRSPPIEDSNLDRFNSNLDLLIDFNILNITLTDKDYDTILQTRKPLIFIIQNILKKYIHEYHKTPNTLEVLDNDQTNNYVQSVLDNTFNYLTNDMQNYIRLYNDNEKLINFLKTNNQFNFFIHGFAKIRHKFKYTFNESRYKFDLSRSIEFKNEIKHLINYIHNNNISLFNFKEFTELGAEFYEIMLFYILYNTTNINTYKIFDDVQNNDSQEKIINDNVEKDLNKLCDIMHGGWVYHSLHITNKSKPSKILLTLTNNNKNISTKFVEQYNRDPTTIMKLQLDNTDIIYTLELKRLLRGQYQSFDTMLDAPIRINDKSNGELDGNKFGDDAFAYTIWICRQEIVTFIDKLLS